MDTAGLNAERRQVTNKGKRRDPDTTQTVMAATWVSPKAAPAINATMIVLDSTSLPVWNVLSQ
jgi:hypothetical protein